MTIFDELFVFFFRITDDNLISPPSKPKSRPRPRTKAAEKIKAKVEEEVKVEKVEKVSNSGGSRRRNRSVHNLSLNILLFSTKNHKNSSR